MIRSLAMIAVASFVVCIICVSGATALGGYDLSKRGWNFPEWNWNDDDRDLRDINWNSPETTKDMNWAGDDDLQIDVPADVTFTQADKPKITITGPRDAVDKVSVEGGHIGLIGHENVRVRVRGLNVSLRGLEGFRHLRIEVAAPKMHSITTSAASKLNIVSLKSDDLDLEVNTASDVTGNVDVNHLQLRVHTGADARLEGRADDVDVEVHTGGDAKLDRMAVKTARVETHTGGTAVLAPTDSADVEAHTGGDVILRSHPPKINSNIHTGGNLRFEDASPSPTPPTTPATSATPATPAKPSVSPSPSPSPSPPKRP